jgi:hypothetical protein
MEGDQRPGEASGLDRGAVVEYRTFPVAWSA